MTAMAIHWECVYDPIWEGNGALKHKIYTKSCVHSVRIFRFSESSIWCTGSRYFLASDSFCMAQTWGPGTERLLCQNQHCAHCRAVQMMVFQCSRAHTYFRFNINFVVLSLPRCLSLLCYIVAYAVSSVAVVLNLFWSLCTDERTKI